MDVNNSGTAVGSLQSYVEISIEDYYAIHRAFRWDGSGAAVSVLDPLPSGGSSSAYANVLAINDNGVAVGVIAKLDSQGVNLGWRPAYWSASSNSPFELATLGQSAAGMGGATPAAINSAGTIVGGAEKYDESGTYLGTRAVKWDASGNVLELTTESLGSFDNAGAVAINDAGKIAGSYAHDTPYNAFAAVWSSSGESVTSLGRAGSASLGYGYALSRAINQSGTVAGVSTKFDELKNYGNVAMRWDAANPDGVELDGLGPHASGETDSTVYDINDAGTIVGWSVEFDDDEFGSFLRSAPVRWGGSGTAITELGGLGQSPVPSDRLGGEATAINNRGVTVGWVESYNAQAQPLGKRAVYWGDGIDAVDLNIFIDPASGWILRSAHDVSDTGWIVGEADFDPDGAGDASAHSRLFLLQLPSLAGDYDRNLVVEPNDYLVWRRTFGAMDELTADGDGNGVVDAGDYTIWRDQLGKSYFAGTGHSSFQAVPEPTFCCFSVVALAIFCSSKTVHRTFRAA
jgi:uncharacterized membrane protein